MTDHQSGAPDESKLEHLEEEIAEVRHRVAEDTGEAGPHFIDEGTEGDDQLDDTIAPPG
jgi:hypothetical protein